MHPYSFSTNLVMQDKEALPTQAQRQVTQLAEGLSELLQQARRWR
jgi:hypothetical protein